MAIQPSSRSIAMFSAHWPPSLAANGIVSYVANLREPLRALGYRVHIIAPEIAAPEEGVFEATRHLRSWPPGKVVDQILGRLAPVESLPFRMGLAIGTLVRRLVREHGVSLIEMEETFGAVYHVRRFASLPAVVRVHGPWFLNGPAIGAPNDRAAAVRNAREARAIALADAVTAPSRDVLDRVRDRFGLSLPHAHVIPNPGPDVPREHVWRSSACDQNLVLFVGRFDRHKGGDLAIRAFAALQKRLPQLRLAFVGPHGPLLDGRNGQIQIHDFVRQAVPDADVRARIEILGQLPPQRISELRRRAFLTLIPSRYENFPMTAVEALAYGCPVVAANTGGMPEVVDHDQTGLCFRPGDVEDLVQKAGLLLTNRDMAGRLAERARRAYEHRFAPALVAAQTAAVYDEVIGQTSSVPSRGWMARRVMGV